MADGYSVILTTAGSTGEAEKLAGGLVEEKLVACAQLLPIGSIYRWEDKTERDSEILLLLKARAELYGKIESYILEHHSYDTPEVLQLGVSQGSPGYLAWITDSSL
jgi:periplasmic divalent cation tolerance protein